MDEDLHLPIALCLKYFTSVVLKSCAIAFLVGDLGSDKYLTIMCFSHLLLMDVFYSDKYLTVYFHSMMQGDSPTVCNSVTSDESKALAQALQEKVLLHYSVFPLPNFRSAFVIDSFNFSQLQIFNFL